MNIAPWSTALKTAHSLPSLASVSRRFAAVLATVLLSMFSTVASSAGSFSGPPMTTARYSASATLLPSGKVLVAGGQATSGYVNAAELYDPATNAWSATGALVTARGRAATALLRTGKVLVAGGYGNTGAIATAELYDPATGVWSAAGTMSTARSYSTATVLTSGKVLVAGGLSATGYVADAELYDPTSNTWSAAGSLSMGRILSAAVLLPSGSVLFIGGAGQSGYASNADLYDPTTNSWTQTTSLAIPQLVSSATLLRDGTVLVIGGESSSGLAVGKAWRFDPSTASWTAVNPLGIARVDHATTLLPDGRILTIGGYSAAGELAVVEVYDPSTSAWTTTGPLSGPRRLSTATLLPSGKVLIAGGVQNLTALSSVEIYDTRVASWSNGGSFTPARQFHTSSLLPSGQVLVTGGFDQSYNILRDTRLYDPTLDTWIAAPQLLYSRVYHSATLVSSGKLLIAGGPGSRTAETFDTATGTWGLAGTMAVERYQHSATLLGSGRVLVVGGQGSSFSILGSVEIYDAATNGWSGAASLATARRYHTATLLPSGKVMVTGGIDSLGADLSSVEIYDPVTNTWSAGPPLSAKRYQHTATLLNSGRVLIAGGYTNDRASTEIYDPQTNIWSAGPSLVNGRFLHTATLLPSGDVVVAGGLGFSGAGAEVYDAMLNQWRPASALAEGRYRHVATLLNTGRVLVVGGMNSAGSAVLGSGEMFDPGSGTANLFGPILTVVTDPVVPGMPVDLDGVKFTGYSEGSTGLTNSSPTNYPLVQLRRVDSGHQTWLTPSPASAFSATTWHSVDVTGVTPGPHAMTMFVNGVPSLAEIVDVINLAPTSTTLASTPNPSMLGQNATLTAQVSGNVPGGTVAFSENAVALTGCDAVPLVSGQAQCATSALALGSHAFVATYSGDINNRSSASSILAHVVTPAVTVPTAPIFDGTSAGNHEVRIHFGAPLNNGGSPILSYAATSAPGGLTASCTAPCTVVTVVGLTNGTSYTFSLVAINAQGASPAAITYATTPVPDRSRVILTSSNRSAAVNESVVLTATVTGASPTGTIRFDTHGMSPCADTALVSGVATCTTSASVAGDYNVDASYAGDLNNAPSSTSLLQRVGYVNTAPAADAGGPYYVTLGGSVILQSNSSDPDGEAVAVSWDINGDDVFTDASDPRAVLTAAQLSALGLGATGTYTIRVKATDPSGASSVASAVLTIANASDYLIETVAGGGTGDGLSASAVPLRAQGVAIDASGNLYIADNANRRVRRVDAGTGIITTVAGNGNGGFNGDGGPAIAASLDSPQAIAIGSDGSLYIADAVSSRIRKVNPSTGIITTVVGNGLRGYAGDGGPAPGASLNAPAAIAVDAGGSIYIADANNSRIRKVDVTTGIITTLAGNGTRGFTGDGSLAVSASIGYPLGVAVGADNAVYLTDADNSRIRKVDAATGLISTIAGNGSRVFSGDGGAAMSAGLISPHAVAVDASGDLYLTDAQRVRKVSAATGIIVTVAGSGNPTFSGDGGAATLAGLSAPSSLAFDNSGSFYIGDSAHFRVRKVDSTTGIINTIAGNGSGTYGGDDGPAVVAIMGDVRGIATDAAGAIYIADGPNYRVRKVAATTRIISTVAGNGVAGYTGDGGDATLARLTSPFGVAVDASGSIYIADAGTPRVRKVDGASGVITTIAGNGSFGYSGDGGPATSASLSSIGAIAVDTSGTLYISDSGSRIRKVDSGTGVITTVAGNGTRGYGGDGGIATSASISAQGVFVDQTGGLYIADFGSNRIRKVDAASGIITTIAGNGTATFSGDGGAATSAGIPSPTYITMDTMGSLYIVGLFNLVRRVDVTTGVITTIAGNGVQGFNGDGGPANSASFGLSISGIASDAAGNIYVSDSTNRRVRRIFHAGYTPPDAPTIGFASAGNTQASVTFAAPANTGGTPITSYRATSSPGNLSAQCAAPCSSIVITGLTNGVAYTFTVTATNGAGTSPSSSSSNSVIPTPAPQFTSANSATFAVKTPGSFNVVATGTPTPTLTRSGALPGGVTFTPATGVLAGTPNNGTVGAYTITFTAKNGVLPNAVQTFTLTVVKADQTINFDALPDIGFGSPNFTLAATTTSALAVAFTSSTPAVCTVAGKTVKLIAAGTCTIAANQAGNASYNAAPQVTRSFAVLLTATTVTTIQTSKEPSVVGQAYTVTATVTSPTGIPKGSVTVSDGQGGTCTDLTLSGAGVASCSMTSTVAGTLTLSGVYSGSSGYAPSTGTAAHLVNQAQTRVAVTSSADPALPGATVTLSAKVMAISPGKGTPTGSIRFTDNGVELGMVPLDGLGVATIASTTLPVGRHPIVATFSGDANFASSVSSTYNQDVVAFPVLQFSASSVTVDEAAGSVTLTVTHSGSALGAVSVAYASANGTAGAGTDYGAVSGILSWAAGDGANQTIVVPIVADGVSEPLERFTVTLTAPTGATLGTRTAITVNIRAN